MKSEIKKFVIKEVPKCLFILLLFSFTNAQVEPKLSLPLPMDDEMVCGLTQPPLILLDVSIWSSEKGYLNYFTYEDFEVYNEEEKLQDIEFFKFDELKNHYTIGFIQEDELLGFKWKDIKVKLKLSKEKKKNFGEVSITVQKGYTSK